MPQPSTQKPLIDQYDFRMAPTEVIKLAVADPNNAHLLNSIFKIEAAHWGEDAGPLTWSESCLIGLALDIPDLYFPGCPSVAAAWNECDPDQRRIVLAYRGRDPRTVAAAPLMQPRKPGQSKAIPLSVPGDIQE